MPVKRRARAKGQAMTYLKRKTYEKLLEPLQRELAEMARWVQESGTKLLVIFEGRDTAGKGGAIRAVADRLNPRQCRVVALSKPSEREAGQWYFQRYVPHLPAKGEIVLFDRSWYNRAGVERVMGFCTKQDVADFFRSAPGFEKQLVDSGIHLVKYWLCCDQEEQEKRFAERLEDPLKRWKLSPIDHEARKHYADYTKAREEMLRATHGRHTPWTLVDFNDQRRGRLTLVADLLRRLPVKRRPVAKPDYPPLKGKPRKECYAVLEPIPDFPLPKD